MLTLTKVAYYTRRIIKLGIIGFFALIILKPIFARSLHIIKKATTPPPTPTPTKPPDTRFGPLPPLVYTPFTPSSPEMFVLDTIEGGLPKLPKIAEVYLVKKKLPSFFDYQEAKKFAARFGFKGNPRIVSKTIYQFLHQEVPDLYFTLDIVNLNFKQGYSSLKDELFSDRLIDVEKEKNKAIAFLKDFSLLKPDLDIQNIKTTLLKPQGNTLVPAISLREAKAVRFDIPKKKINNAIPIVFDDFDQSNIYLIYSNAPEEKDSLIEAKYTYWHIDYKNPASYPLISEEKAWQLLKEGKAYLARKGRIREDKIPINKVYLAYWERERFENFLQPVFVFFSETGYVFYVPAVAE